MEATCEIKRSRVQDEEPSGKSGGGMFLGLSDVSEAAGTRTRQPMMSEIPPSVGLRACQIMSCYFWKALTR